MPDDVRLYQINTTTLNNLNNRQFAFETVADADLNWKMSGGKNNSGEVTKFLGKDKAAQVSTLVATGAVTITSGSIAIDTLSLSTVNSYQLLYGDFQQSSNLKFEDDKLRVGSSNTPEYQVDIDSISQDNLRLRNTSPDANGPLLVLEKTSSSPANDDSCGKIIFRGTNDDPSVPEVDFASIECLSDDVGSDSTDGSMTFKTKNAGVDTETLTLKSDNVGIGTSNPDVKLHVQGSAVVGSSSSSAAVITLERNATNILQFISPNTADARIYFGDEDVVGSGQVVYNHVDDTMSFKIDSVETMRMDSNQNTKFSGHIDLKHVSGATPAADHTCVYAKADDTLHMIASDASTKEIITLLATRNIQWTAFTPTVTLVGGAGNTVPEYTVNSGRYRRYDDIVYVCVMLSGDGGDEGAGSGVINIALPVTSGADILSFDHIPIGNMYNNENYNILNGNISASSNTVSLTYRNTIDTSASATGANQDNTNRSISLIFWYEVD